MRRLEVTHQFVDAVPDEPAEGVIYVSTTRAVVVHRCCCGCGSKVTTPLGPGNWQVLFDGNAISLKPSIDNWKFDCGSHYKIKRNRVQWLARWSQLEVEVGRMPGL